MTGRRGERRTRSACLGALVLLSMAAGCVHDPLDPRGELEHRVVREVEQAEQRARGREAYERARARLDRVKRGQSVDEVEAALEAIVVAQEVREGSDAKRSPRAKLVEGFLCLVPQSPLRKRWLFGYDEGGMVLIGFAIDFERHDPDDDGDWQVRGIDTRPRDDCPDAGYAG